MAPHHQRCFFIDRASSEFLATPAHEHALQLARQMVHSQALCAKSP